MRIATIFEIEGEPAFRERERKTIAELAETVRGVVGFEGGIVYDTSKPDGTPRKLMDVSRLAALGWRASIALEDGLCDAYSWFVNNPEAYRR